MRRILYQLGALAAVTAAVGCLAGSAGATDAYPTTNDQSTTISTGRWFYYGVSPSQVSSYLSANGARLTQIRVVNPSTPTFAVTMVRNTGAYASGWYWWYGVTPSQLASYLSSTHSRLISLEPYQTGGGLRFAAVSVPNSGSAARAWWWYYGVSASQINSYATANNARPVSIRPYMSGGTRVFAVVMVRNTGQDFKGWQWWAGASISTISSDLTANTERVISFAKDPAGGFDAIAVKSEGEAWYWYYGLTGSAVVSNLVSHGTRAIDVSPYISSGSLRFTSVELDDSNPPQSPINAESTRVRNYAQTHGWSGGWHGGYFLNAASSTPSMAYNSNFRFEPASAIKVLYLLYTLKHLTPAQLSGPITYYYPSAVTNPGACPNPAWEGPGYAHTTTIQNALNKMMRNSDNIMTRAFAKKWGLANVQAMASGLGMSSTHLRQAYIGCGFRGGVRNELTLRDVDLLYRQVQNSVALSGANRATFFSTLLGGSPSTDSWGIVVNQEAAALGKSSIASQFKAAMDVRYKGGSYGFCMTKSSTCNPYKTDLTLAGRVVIPFKSSGRIAPRAYLFGDYVNDLVIPCAIGSGCAAETAAGNALWNTAAEEARPAIHAALTTW
jgi:Beta-lactamase enzyme family/Polyglycine hydrolase-like, structural repeat